MLSAERESERERERERARDELFCSKALAPNLCGLPHSKCTQPKETNRAAVPPTFLPTFGRGKQHAMPKGMSTRHTPANSVCGLWICFKVSKMQAKQYQEQNCWPEEKFHSLTHPSWSWEVESCPHPFQALHQPSEIICKIAFLQELLGLRVSATAKRARRDCFTETRAAVIECRDLVLMTHTHTRAQRRAQRHARTAPVSQPLHQYRGIASTRQKPCMSSCDPFNSTTMIHNTQAACCWQQVLVRTTEFKLELPCLDVPHLELSRRCEQDPLTA